MRQCQKLRGTETNLRQMEWVCVCVCVCVCERERERQRERQREGDSGEMGYTPPSAVWCGDPSRKAQPSHLSWEAVRWTLNWPYSFPNQTRGRVDAGKGDQWKEPWRKCIIYILENRALGVGKDATLERQKETKRKPARGGNLIRHCTNNLLSCLKLMPTQKGAQDGTNVSRPPYPWQTQSIPVPCNATATSHKRLWVTEMQLVWQRK